MRLILKIPCLNLLQDVELGVSNLAKFDRNNEKSFTVSSIPPSPSKKISSATVSTDTKQLRKEFYRQAAEAEKWCRENLQSAWWTEAHPKHEHTVDDLSSRLAFIWSVINYLLLYAGYTMLVFSN